MFTSRRRNCANSAPAYRSAPTAPACSTRWGSRRPWRRSRSSRPAKPSGCGIPGRPGRCSTSAWNRSSATGRLISHCIAPICTTPSRGRCCSEKPDAIHLGHKCTGLTQTADHVELQFEGKPPVTAKLVVGADGVHSVLRGILFGTPQPQFCGVTAWRGVVPMEKLPPTVSRTVATQWAGPGRSRRAISVALGDASQLRRHRRAQ